MTSPSTHVVAIGGGGGATQVLRAVGPFATGRTAVIAVTDTGRSTGLARTISNIPAPGDLRATIAAFAGNELIGTLLQHRFSGAGVAQLEGMAFGNLLLGALAEITGDFSGAVEQVAALAETGVTVLPISPANTQLCATLADGSTVEGELHVRGLRKAPIERLFLQPSAPADERALAAIRDADMVVIGPGSLFTTVLADLLFEGVAEALRDTSGTVVYVCNTTTQPGQTDGFGVLDHVRRIVETVGPGTLDAVLINTGTPPAEALGQYEAEGLLLLRPTDEELAAVARLGVRPVATDLAEDVGQKRALWNKQDTVRHDTDKLGAALRDLLAP